MKKRFSFFIIGVVLLVISLPVSTPMAMEFFHKLKMKSNYQITNINDDDPPAHSTYVFNNHIVEINETMSDVEVYKSPWEHNIGLGDLEVMIDGKQIDLFPEHPIRIDDKGLSRYYGELAYLYVRDRWADETYFVIIGKKTRELIKEMPNGDIVGHVPEEELDYAVHTLALNGEVKSETIHFTDRNAYHTQLLNHGGVVPYRIGYYTDLLEAYPSFLFPIVFPFFTFISGLSLAIIFFPRKRVRE